jgi:glycosyltransferase involved in cell wall biosynthesis
MSRLQSVIFFVRTSEPRILELMGFYRDDLRALRDLGLEVRVVTRVRDLPKQRADLVYAWWFGYGFFAVAWARLIGRPSIVVGAVHTGAGGESIDDYPLHKRLLMKAALRLATRTVFLSNADLARLGSVRASQASVSYCAVDLQTYQPASAPPARFVLTISHLTQENVTRKMVLESIDAFAKFFQAHPDFRYVIAGVHGNAVRAVRAHIAARGLEDVVDLPGRVSLERKLALLQTATAYLQPTRCEAFGLAILEAAACGCPVITNREPCVREINGDAVLYGDTEDELAAQLSALVEQPLLRTQMRERGLSNVVRFSYEARRSALRSMLESVGAFDCPKLDSDPAVSGPAQR